MKKINVLKAELAIYINVLTLISAVLNVFEFLKQCVLNILQIPTAIIYGASAVLAVVLPAYWLIWDASEIGWRIFYCIMLWLLLAIFIGVAHLIVSLATGVAKLFDKLTNTSTLILLINTVIVRCFDNYLDLCPRRINKAERFFALLFCLPVYYISCVLKWMLKTLRYLCYPLLMSFSGWITYKELYSGQGPFTTAEHFMNVVLIIAVIAISAFAAFAIGLAIKSSQENTDFNLEDILHGYSQIFSIHPDEEQQEDEKNSYDSGNFEKRQNNSTAQTTSEKYYVEYYTLLSKAKNIDELKQMRNQEMKKIHPDVAKGMDEKEAYMRSAQLNEAYSFLKDGMSK